MPGFVVDSVYARGVEGREEELTIQWAEQGDHR